MRKKKAAGSHGTDRSWRDRIVATAEVCHGQPCIRGTRVLVSVVLDNLADGVSQEELLTSYPSLRAGDVQAALLYAAELARGAVLTA